MKKSLILVSIGVFFMFCISASATVEREIDAGTIALDVVVNGKPLSWNTGVKGVALASVIDAFQKPSKTSRQTVYILAHENDSTLLALRKRLRLVASENIVSASLPTTDSREKADVRAGEFLVSGKKAVGMISVVTDSSSHVYAVLFSKTWIGWKFEGVSLVSIS